MFAKKFYLTAVILSFFLGHLLSEESDLKKGLVTYVDGSAKKQKRQELQWSSVYKNTPVQGGERVRTMTKSRAELVLAELEVIRMAPKTTIDILKLYDETAEKTKESNILLQKGDLWANVSVKSKSASFSIGTPVAAAAITGTTLRMSVEEDSSSELRVYQGEVALSNVPTPSALKSRSLEPHEIEGPHEIAGPHQVSLEEWTIIVRSMQKIKLNKKGEVTYSGSFTRNDTDEQSEWIRWNMSRDRSLK